MTLGLLVAEKKMWTDRQSNKQTRFMFYKIYITAQCSACLINCLSILYDYIEIMLYFSSLS